MGTFKVSDYFNTMVEDNKLIIHHKEGCQTLVFGESQSLPRQTEVITALNVWGVDINLIYGLQYGGSNRYILYPFYNTPILNQSEIFICGTRVKVYLTPPMIRDIEPRNIDVFISGLPLEMGKEVVLQKCKMFMALSLVQIRGRKFTDTRVSRMEK